MPERALIVTDMDGTLLNHHDYGYAAVVPILEQLQQSDTPVILNTSKTFAELESWVFLLKLPHPFVVENGSAIFIPHNYFIDLELSSYPVDSETYPGYQVITPGKPLSALKEFILKLKPNALDLTECSVELAMQVTGLNKQQALAAQQRQFSVPLQFEQIDEQSEFTRAAVNAGFAVLKGGRFLHLLGQTDKGLCSRLLQRLYQKNNQSDYAVIALGDSPNDQAMLEQADIAVIVRSPSSDLLNPAKTTVIRTQQQAPEGWVEGVQRALGQQSIHLTTGTGNG